MADRRANVRAVVRLEVKNRNLKRVPLFVTANLSVGGMFLITKNPLPEQTRLRLRFCLPKDKAPLNTVARVLWVREEDSVLRLPPGMGVQFLECSPEDRERIRAFIEEWGRAFDAAHQAKPEDEP
ncbi:MAG: hypothetical protein A2V67_07030 [Deltaproteobacteria bacterium RBG_13_61_14]|nr:MAG: hypothetical protein A2V67_07030 [Deltaproteobacteria bacterium RBG_13_61_14]